MKSFLAIPALFAASALAAPDWSFTFTFSNAQSTWTSCTYATGAPNATTTAASTEYTGPSEWTSSTSYTAIYSSGTSTWGIPTEVSYSVGETWTSMIPAATGSTSSVAVSSSEATSVAAITTAPASTTSAGASSYTGAAVPNVNGKMAGVGAIAVAGLALVL